MDSLSEYFSIVFVLVVLSLSTASLRDKLRHTPDERSTGVAFSLATGPVQFTLTFPQGLRNPLRFEMSAREKGR